MMDEEKEILHKYWSHDRKRMAHVLYDKEFDGFVVRMYENNKKIKSVPMSTGTVRHSEQYAEDAAENWVMGYYQ
jgi:hypothetical protein|tara:strand:- start:836 stop:1057 length:222 start_codon:yes stop_codon:yes gene_type:complete